MLATSRSVALIGVDAVPVEVEVDVAAGLPAFTIVGLPDQAVSEARERVRAAIRNSGLPFPTARITVNLAPADLRKEGPIYDLPIALGLLAAQDLLPVGALTRLIAAGELALDGTLRPIQGAVNLALLAAGSGEAVILPEASAPEAALIEGVTVLGAASLRAAVEHLSGRTPILPASAPPPSPDPEALLDLLDIKGQSQAKRALEVALAGGHNLLMVGSPGSGKTMLARRAPSLLPRLTRAGGAGGHAHPQRRRNAERTARPDPDAAVPCPPQHRLGCRTDRRGQHSASRRGVAGAPGGAISGRISRILAAGRWKPCVSRWKTDRWSSAGRGPACCTRRSFSWWRP